MAKIKPFLKVAYKQIFQIFSANILKGFFGFIGTIFVLRGWSTADIGDMYTLVGVMLLLQQFCDLGTGSSFIQIMSRNRNNEESVIAPFLGVKTIAVFILFLFFIIVCGIFYFISQSREIFGLGFICLSAILGVYGAFFLGLVTARQEFTKLSILKVMPPLLKTIMLAVLFFMGKTNYVWLILAFILPNITLFTLGVLFTRYPIYKANIRAVFSKRGLQLYEMSRWVFLFGFGQIWFSQLDVFMLKRMSSDYQIAQFVSAHRMASVLMMLSQAIFTVMLPKMNNFKTDKDIHLLSLQIFKFYLVCTVAVVPLVFVAPHIVPVILGEKYLDSIPILQVFLFQVVGLMFINTQALVFFRKNLLPWLVLFTFIQLAANFIGNYLVIYQYKALGAVAVSSILNNLFYWIMFVFCLSLLKPEKTNTAT